VNFFDWLVLKNHRCVLDCREMSSFATSLWDSIFTPGPTPVLIKAMNISFFALLALLIPLTYFTRNIHVFFLTLLSMSLWVAMQW